MCNVELLITPPDFFPKRIENSFWTIWVIFSPFFGVLVDSSDNIALWYGILSISPYELHASPNTQSVFFKLYFFWQNEQLKADQYGGEEPFYPKTTAMETFYGGSLHHLQNILGIKFFVLELVNL